MDAQMSDRFLLEDGCVGFPSPRLPYSTLMKTEPHPPALPAPTCPHLTVVPQVCHAKIPTHVSNTHTPLKFSNHLC